MNWSFNQKKPLDRFIMSRSAERDRKVEKSLINDKAKLPNLIPINTSHKTKIQTRTPSIINSDNTLDQKIYLSLLKSQIFTYKKENSHSNHKHSTSRKQYQHETTHKHVTPLSNNKHVHTRDDIVRNLNDVFFSKDITTPTPLTLTTAEHNISHNKHINPLLLSNKIENNNNFLCKKLFDDCGKSSASFFNLDLEDNESARSFFEQKSIPKTAYKVLDAPNLREDFYLHLIDWSKRDILAVGLENILYLWNGTNMTVDQVSRLPLKDDYYYSSISWSNDGKQLIAGTNLGEIEIFDIETKTKIVTISKAFTGRIDVITPMNLNNNVFTCGAFDTKIKSYDVRDMSKEVHEYNGHKQEVCGLKWSHDDKRLASGGNDNKLIIWNALRKEPEQKFSGHVSAVKALDWSPMRLGYLLSGGGAEDKTIKLWNINTMLLVDSVYTSSQVCNLAFSKNSNEFVSTHGYADNYILVWDFAKMDIKATLKGLKARVVYMSVGPDNERIVTGSGDETLRFWKVFNQNIKRNKYDDGREELFDITNNSNVVR